MHWEIDEDAAQQGQEGEADMATWATRLRLHLPKLGEVDARLRLQGNQLALSVCAASESTRTLMRAAGPSMPKPWLRTRRRAPWLLHFTHAFPGACAMGNTE